MAGQMTLLYIILLHNQEQAQCYQINVDLFYCALTERKPRGGGGGPTIPPLCVRVGALGSKLSLTSKYGNEQP